LKAEKSESKILLWANKRTPGSHFSPEPPPPAFGVNADGDRRNGRHGRWRAASVHNFRDSGPNRKKILAGILVFL
jgi:hypothetical protein